MPFQKGNTFGGRRSRKSAGATYTPIRRIIQDDPEDEEIGEDDGGEEMVMEDGGEDDEGEEEAGTPAADEEDEDDEDAPPTVTAMPRRKGRGRGRGAGRRSTRTDYGTPQPRDGDGEDGSESGTPFRRRRGRPEGSGRPRGRGGFRGRRRTAHHEPPRVVIDKDGQTLDVLNDEVQVDYDEEGETKVDANGNLLGNREYRVRTFKIIDRGDRLYMLSTEPARCCGFRDSYLFFAKHPKLFKVLLAEDEKRDLIDRDILPSSYKGRNIGVVTARSVFREFGARIIVGGRKVIDDYKAAEARANGEIEGELADPDDRVPDGQGEYDRNRYVAWFGASEVYRQVGQGQQQSKQGLVGKKRAGITVGNWQWMHAREASRFNTAIAAARRAVLDGVYDAHTNLIFYPTIMQPTHAKWEQIPTPLPHAEETNGMNDRLTNVASDHMDLDAPSTLFTPISPIISRNFAMVDTAFVAPSISSAGYPGPDGIITDPTSGPNGISGISQDLIDELPEDCRQAFEQAKQAELKWQNSFGNEAQSAGRRALKVGVSGYPV